MDSIKIRPNKQLDMNKGRLSFYSLILILLVCAYLIFRVLFFIITGPSHSKTEFVQSVDVQNKDYKIELHRILGGATVANHIFVYKVDKDGKKEKIKSIRGHSKVFKCEQVSNDSLILLLGYSPKSIDTFYVSLDSLHQ
ncbi:hypothetical protein GF337_18725 [candidate division KSB1 bacterium]|nr:hypothetical protein [candidate division KSB1 bacterium]